MNKIIALFILVIISGCSNSDDYLKQANTEVKKNYPNIEIQKITKIDDKLFEIVIANEIYYLTSDFKHLIAGNVINISTQENLTESSLKKKRLVILKKLDSDNMIIFKPKKVNHVLTVFTDTSCPYCQKLHGEVKDLLKNNIEIRYVLFSRNGNQMDAYKEMVSAWCSDDRKNALEKLYDGQPITEKLDCTNPIIKNFEIASKLSITGTPMTFTETGEIIPGYQSSDKIVQFIENYK
ncbi:MAG: hypothetical protein CMD88_01305 [Gammaproteobacteria bacterium]|nr:hypothetical protein [Gammaproteobacteria bacterium]|tara:strand:+ start:176595 stop:177305 length:711 start_codon:yes stop_codon:yes gene_type:complete